MVRGIQRKDETMMTSDTQLAVGRTRYRLHALTSSGALRDQMYSVGEWAATPELAISLRGNLHLREGDRIAVVEQVYEGTRLSQCNATRGLPEHTWRTVGVVRVVETLS